MALVLDQDVVGHDDGGEDGEAVLGIEGALVVVGVDAGQLDLVAGPAGVAQVAEEDGILGPAINQIRTIPDFNMNCFTLAVFLL